MSFYDEDEWLTIVHDYEEFNTWIKEELSNYPTFNYGWIELIGLSIHPANEELMLNYWNSKKQPNNGWHFFKYYVIHLTDFVGYAEIRIKVLVYVQTASIVAN